MEQLPKIARERLAQQQADSEHPAADVLGAFLEQGLNQGEREQVLAHLARCAECREVVALATPDIEPALMNVRPQRRAWYEWSLFRFGGLAAALTVVIVAVVLFRPHERPAKEAAANIATVPTSSMATDSATASQSATAPPANAPAPRSSVQDDKLASRAAVQEEDKLAQSLRKDVPLPPPPEQRGEKKLYLKGAVGGIAAGDRDKFQDRQNDKEAAGALAKLGSVQNKAGVFGGAAGKNVAVPGPSSVADERTQSQQNQVAQQNGGVQQAQSSQQNESFDQLESNPAATKQAEASGAPAAQGSPARETVTVTAAAPTTSTTTAEIAPTNKVKRAPKAPQPTSTYIRPDVSGVPVNSTLRWTISAAATVQKSTDNGAHWQDVPVADGVSFRTLAVAGTNLWAGGSALYHSSDMGEHWERVKVGKKHDAIQGEIIGIELPSDATNAVMTSAPRITITTTTGQKWVSSDGGRSWEMDR